MHKVFISYSHDSREHADRVLALADRLIQDGVDCILDQYEESPAEGWTRWMDRQIRGAEFVLMIFTETYAKRVNGEEETGKGLGVKWEGKLIYQHLYQADANTRFIPVVFAPEQAQFISTPLPDATYYLVSNDEGYEKLYRRLTNQPKKQKPKLGKLRQLPPRQRKQDFFAPKIQTAKLPTTTSTLFGREKELQLLDAAWADEHTHLVSLVAWGGVGKTALVNEWLSRLERNHFRGAERVFGWSFYSQGTKEDRNVSADSFFDEALRWFALTSTSSVGAPILSPWDKGVRLAELLRQQKTLLILDGVEPLQYSPGPMQGRLKDQGLQALLKELAHYNSGLCVVTTRVAIADLAHKEKTSAKHIDLEHLSPEAGAQLLKSLKVTGTEAELRTASTEFAGHALALNLLGSYLATVHDGEIRKRDLIPQLTEDEEHGGHARRVMESYERWLTGTPELGILYLMGLFDRPAAKGAIDVLLAAPAILGLTSNLQNLPLAKLQYALKRLRDLHLLAEKDQHRPDTLDCHPLVREHFGEKLRQNNPAAWKEAHSRLFKYYKNLPIKQLPDMLEEMEPLFAAVAHGCQAGRHQEALDDVYSNRINRKEEYYCLKKLGAYGADLAALSSFFENPWSKPKFDLTDEYKALVLGIAGFNLRALGRLREATEATESSLNAYISQENWKDAAIIADTLSGLYRKLSEVKQGVDHACQSVDFADRTDNWRLQRRQRARLADALHQAGEVSKAETLFHEAEAIQMKRELGDPFLYALRGFWFCDLLLSQGKYLEVIKRASSTIEIAKQNKWLLDIALDKLSLGHALMLQMQEEGIHNFSQAKEYLHQAVEGLRESGEQDELPLGLFARATLFRLQNEFTQAETDLEEAREIAERGEMNLHLADYHLEACRLCLAEQKENSKKQKENGKLQEAKGHLHTAAEMIEKMGYGRRKPEVEALRREIEALKI